MKLSEAQKLIREIYGERDSRRGILGTSLHLGEEIGELFRAIRSRNPGNIEDELADSLAWLLSVSELLRVD
ncbi:MAG: MazG nucleotide pyrophosphohydrolase domain-containing protein, partial [Candidatus Korarchaeum sp.]|nr:MazG nucleotide pyrophosphohydrolase domain-containing protein [Candidatus Korarchaeum sp.]